MVFDVTNEVCNFKDSFFHLSQYEAIMFQKSFENMKVWLQEIDQHSNQNVKKLLIGNKCDLTYDRVVGHATAKVSKTYR